MEFARRAVRASPVERVEPDRRRVLRRRLVVAATLAVGAVLLGVSLSVRPGDAVFYPLTASVAVTLLAGAVLSGPLHLGRTRSGELC